MMRKLWQDAKAQMGWQGVAGVVLLAIAGALHLAVVAPLESRTADMKQRIDAAQAEDGGQSGPARGALGKFYHGMPSEKDVNDVMASIYAEAAASHVALKEASFHLEKDNTPIVRYVMDFPMVGKYSSIRMLVSRVVARNSFMALEQIDFRRDRISDADLKANVRLTLFLRKR